MCWFCEFILINNQLVYKIKILFNDIRGLVGGKIIVIDGRIGLEFDYYLIGGRFLWWWGLIVVLLFQINKCFVF